MILEMNRKNPEPRRISQVVESLREGELVVYPTDTVYGIGCDLTNSDAVKKLKDLVKHIKQQPDHSPLSFICQDLSNISEYAFVRDMAYRMMKRMTPGPYTFILEATDVVPHYTLTDRDEVGIRIPDHAIPLAIVEKLGNPLVTTSVTHPEGALLPDPWSIDDFYGHAVDIIVDGGYVFPEPSSVLDLSGEYPKLIREGKGPVGDLDYVEFV
jgi:tRNA threonylcarbamoyl adenosine modification protein (Sua5/YciO/YrdC/YwlC family)